MKTNFISPTNTYYTEIDGKHFESDSLKRLILESGIKPQMNESVIDEFLTNGFIYGRDTLIKGVFKYGPWDCLDEAERLRSLALDKSSAIKNWHTDAVNAVLGSSQKNEICAPLSSGYDSNFIVNTFIEDGRNIKAFSVGGKSGKNELPSVEENAKSYNNLQLFTALTDNYTLQNLPDIVWRLEGSVYEIGVFLQYELMKLAAQNGVTELICGECADQVFNEHFLSEDRMFPANDGKPMYYAFDQYPFIYGTQLILKKSGIMASSFGIETKYPFLNEKLIVNGYSLRYENGTDKRIHVADCREHLPKQVLKNISKIGGATQGQSMFSSRKEMNAFFDMIEKTDIYKSHSGVINSRIPPQPDLRNRIKNTIKRRRDILWNEDFKISEYLKVLYLVVFEKLFIDKRCDMSLDESVTGLKELFDE